MARKRTWRVLKPSPYVVERSEWMSWDEAAEALGVAVRSRSFFWLTHSDVLVDCFYRDGEELVSGGVTRESVARQIEWRQRAGPLQRVRRLLRYALSLF